MPEQFSDRTWLWISAVLYAAAFLWATVSMLRAHGRSRGIMLGLVISGLTVQTFGLHLRGIAGGGCPVRNTFEVVQFIIWSFTVLYMILGPAFRLSLLGYFTAGLAATMSVTSLLVPHWDDPARHPVFGGVPWIEVHASLALFAYGAFGTLALTSMMFLLQTFSLKRKHLRGVFGFLPSIVALETINFRLLLTGISVLSISILLGGIYFAKEPESISATKLLVALAVWCAYCAVFFLRTRRLLVSVGLAWACMALFGVALYSIGVINSGMSRHPIPQPGTALVSDPGDGTEAM